MNRLGLDLQSAFGMPPLDYLRLARELGCGHVAIGLGPMPWNPCGFPPWSLRDDPALRCEAKALTAELGVAISMVAGFSLKAGVDVGDLAGDMDVAADLGASMLGTVGMDRDVARAHDQLALLTGMAAARGMDVVLDYAPHQAINSLQGALAALRHAGSPRARLSVDAMHVFRSGGDAAELAALDPALIGYAQLCDVPWAAAADDYAHEACFERRIPGEGDLPLTDFVAALPPDVLVGVETPILSAVEHGTPLRDVLKPAVEASRALLESQGGRRAI